jgi:hypothetical protein
VRRRFLGFARNDTREAEAARTADPAKAAHAANPAKAAKAANWANPAKSLTNRGSGTSVESMNARRRNHLYAVMLRKETKIGPP